MTVLLVISALALGMAPLLMPESYSWVANTTSESAAQGLPGAWLARSGFVLFGVGVIWLAFKSPGRWGRWGAATHISFGLLMVAAAVFSNSPIANGVPVDTLEDTLHSFAATLMGFAFAIGVVVVAWRRPRVPAPSRVLDVLAIIASVAIPLGMTLWPQVAGLLQRSMFLIAYLWYSKEALTDRALVHLDEPSEERQFT